MQYTNQIKTVNKKVMAKKTTYTKDGVEVDSSSDKYKGHIFYDEDGVGYKCLGYEKKLGDCVYLNLKTNQEVVGCMDGFYYNKPIHVVNNYGYGKVINQLYNQWTAVKTEKEYANWQEKVRSTVFGTYGDIPIEEVLENFDFGNAPINSFHLKTFKQELKTAYKGIKYAKGGVITDADKTVEVWETHRGVYQVFCKDGQPNGREALLNDKFYDENKASLYARKIVAESPKAYPKGIWHYLGVTMRYPKGIDYEIGGL